MAFNPDAYLASKQISAGEEFNPDAYLSKKKGSDDPGFFGNFVAPILAPVSEAAAGAVRGGVKLAESLTVDPINAALQLSGVDSQILKPSESELFSHLGLAGGQMGEGTARDIIRAGSELALPGAAIGQLTRSIAGAVPVAQTIGSGIAQQVAQGTARADVGFSALSGAGGSIGEKTGGASGATIGSFVAPISASLTRRAFTGGVSGLKSTREALADFAEIGVTPTAGTATGSRLQQGFENLSSKILGGAAIRKSFDKVTNAMQNRLKVISKDLSKVTGDVEAGRVIQKGIKGEGGFIDRFLFKSGSLWNHFDSLIDDTATVNASNTTKVLDDLVNDTQFGKILNNPLVTRIKDALNDAGGLVDYKTFRSLRSSIGERLGGNEMVSDIPRAQLKRLYGSLSEDLKVLASESGTDAVSALSRANKFTAAGHGRIDDFVERIAGKVELDKVFQAIAKGGEGTQSINAIKRSLKPDEWDAVVSNVVRRMGKATSNHQDEISDVFSVNKFLTDYDKLGPAKKVLFSGSKKLDGYSANLSRIAAASRRYKDGLKEMANPSGTGQFNVNVGLIGSAGGAAASGRVGALGLIVGAVAVNSGAARLMANPRFVKWLAATPRVNTASHLASLADLAEETGEHEAIQELIESLRQPNNKDTSEQ